MDNKCDRIDATHFELDEGAVGRVSRTHVVDELDIENIPVLAESLVDILVEFCIRFRGKASNEDARVVAPSLQATWKGLRRMMMQVVVIDIMIIIRARMLLLTGMRVRTIVEVSAAIIVVVAIIGMARRGKRVCCPGRVSIERAVSPGDNTGIRIVLLVQRGPITSKLGVDA